MHFAFDVNAWVRALRNIKYCALTTAFFILGAEACLFI
jgi:hypothetical protein